MSFWDRLRALKNGHRLKADLFSPPPPTRTCPACAREGPNVMTEAQVIQISIRWHGGPASPHGVVCDACWEAEKEWQRVRIVDDTPLPAGAAKGRR